MENKRIKDGRNQILIFRKSKRNPKTGNIEYAGPGKVFPIWVDA